MMVVLVVLVLVMMVLVVMMVVVLMMMVMFFFILSRAELEAHLQLNEMPHFAALTETLLEGESGNPDTLKPTLSGYSLVSQRNRVGRKGGGIVLLDMIWSIVLRF